VTDIADQIPARSADVLKRAAAGNGGGDKLTLHPHDPAESGTPAHSYYQRLAAAKVVPLWRVPGTDAPEPVPGEVPWVWRWRDILPLLHEAATVIDLGEDSQRRTLNAFNPGRRFGTTHTMVAGYQLVLPGETAPALGTRPVPSASCWPDAATPWSTGNRC